MNILLLFKNSKGFTLVEVLITIAILGIVMAIGAAVLIQTFEIIPNTNQRMSTRQLAEINLSTIASFVRNAESIDIINDTITISENGSSKIIKLEDESIKKNGKVLINDIEKFFIEKDSDLGQDNLYIITIEKCSQEECEDNVLLSQQVSIRN
jgi:prepilin-type N-terminal cleavage/methylation domain-containing protein